MLPKIIVILGPTASGKSSLAVRLAKKFNGEIVNADSRQVYREMDIGTGKTNEIEDLKRRGKTVYISGVRHHLVDVALPNKQFTLAQYQRLAFKVIDDILRRGKLPIIAGGTGLYVKAVVDNLDIPRVAPNKKLRNKLEKLSSRALFARLKKLDPKTAAAIDKHNRRRLIRALEVILAKKTSFKELQKTKKPRYEALQTGLKVPREILRKKIENRFNQMIKNGLVEETQKLLKNYNPDLPSMSGIGYNEIRQYLENKIALDQAVEMSVKRTYQYAKRQMTWFKKDQRIIWITDPKVSFKIIYDFLKLNNSRT